MTRLFAFLLVLLLSAPLLRAQEEALPECFIDFEEKRIKVDEEVAWQIDSAWDGLKRGKRVRLTVLDAKENKLKDGDRMILSQKRCSTMMDYIMKKDISVVSYAVSIDYFDKKKKSPVSEMSNAGYRSMADRAGIYTIILYKEGHEPIPFTGSDSLALRYKNCQEFTVSIAGKSEITGMAGTIVRFQAGSLVNMDGSTPSCATAKICLREYYSKSDMIAAGLTTHSYDRMLVSGGMIHISATCEGKELRLKSGKPMQVLFPTNGAKKEKGMHTFYGKHGDNLTNWLPSTRKEGEEPAKTPPPREVDGESIEGDYYEDEEDYSKLDYYFLQSSRMGWINCDKFYEIPAAEKTDLYVKADTALKPAVRLVFTDINSVLPGYYFSADRTVKFNDIPKGKAATVIVYAQKGEQIFYGTEEVKIGSVRTVEMTLSPVSKAEFENKMKQLD